MSARAKHIILSFRRASSITLFVWLCCITSQTLAQKALSREFNIKAVFILNFTQFVEWPASAFAAPDAPFVIGILGEDPFRAILDETVSGEKVNGHPILVQRFATVKEITRCHILYISDKIENNLVEVISELPAKNILTVGDRFDFTRSGGVIRFQTLNNKIRLQINLSAARAAEINISSKLLRLADIVGPTQ